VTTNEIILAVICAVLVVFSLTVALVVPKRNRDFPGRQLGLFFGVAVLLVAGMLAAVEVIGEEHEEAEAAEVAEEGQTGEEAAPAATEPGDTGAADTGAPDTGGADAGAEGETGAAPAGDPVDGKEIFAGSGCASCHTLADAAATGQVGPNLDDTQPPFELVVDRVTNGQGAMPAFEGQLSEEEIQNVAAYVVEATSG
jgi:mono/diheme cytochrome c family protein